MKPEEEKTLLINRIKRLLGTAQLSSWEKEFLESILKQLDYKNSLSEKQMNVLKRIERKSKG